MRPSIKTLLGTFLFLVAATAASARNYNFNTPEECNIAMREYVKIATTLENDADRNGQTQEAENWFMTEAFFNNVSSRGSSLQESCNNGQCQMKRQGTCGLVGTKTSNVWMNLVAPLLDQQINRLSTKIPDPELITHHSITVTCEYAQGNVNYDHCTAKLS